MPEDAKSAQRQRLASALRANLKRRKAAAARDGDRTAGRGRDAAGPEATDEHDDAFAQTGGTERD